RLVEEATRPMSPIAPTRVNDRVKALITDLKDDDFQRREQAEDSLVKELSGPQQALYLRAVCEGLANEQRKIETKRHAGESTSAAESDFLHVSRAIQGSVLDRVPLPGGGYRSSLEALSFAFEVWQGAATLSATAQAAQQLFRSKPTLSMTESESQRCN